MNFERIIFVLILALIIIFITTYRDSNIYFPQDRTKQSSKATIVERKVRRRNFSHIYFLKTHKTASSTIENIMMRLAYNYNKTIARKMLKIVCLKDLVYVYLKSSVF